MASVYIIFEDIMDARFSSAFCMLITLVTLFACKEISAEKAEALFVFGDSYADTGNHNPYNQSVNQPWRKPNGFLWPGYPAGRVSPGKIQTDFWADILGFPSPIAYELLRSHHCNVNPNKIKRGVNFAVGGSGIFRDFVSTPVAEQVQHFKKLIAGGSGFDSQKLSKSVVLISVAGNDYDAFTASQNGSIEGLVDLVKPVVSGILEAVKDLYETGLRNFVVSNVAALGCGAAIGKTSCDSKYNGVIDLHTELLIEGVNHLRSDLKGSSIIITDLVSASNYIFNNSKQFGFVEIFLPCCGAAYDVTTCAEEDEFGRALFEVCDNVNEKLLWDSAHPTERGWFELMSLYSNGTDKKLSFVEGADNIIDWVQSLGFTAYNVSSQSAMISPFISQLVTSKN